MFSHSKSGIGCQGWIRSLIHHQGIIVRKTCGMAQKVHFPEMIQRIEAGIGCGALNDILGLLIPGSWAQAGGRKHSNELNRHATHHSRV